MLTCFYCDAEGPMTRDHFVPLSKMGRNGWSNVVLCCESCNAAKGDRYPTEEECAKFIAEKRSDCVESLFTGPQENQLREDKRLWAIEVMRCLFSSVESSRPTC